jgi:protein involved in polysaccharide export with SLBB domain
LHTTGTPFRAKGYVRELLATLLATAALIGCVSQPPLKGPAETARATGPATAAKTVAVAVADVDGDGHLDIIAGAGDPGLISISFGDGKSGVAATQHLPVEGDVRAVAVADVNGDGHPDIIYSAQRQSSGIRVLINQGGRGWLPGKGPIEVNKYEGIVAADLDGDGYLDIIAANATSDNQGGIQVWFGTGRGAWRPGPSPTVTGSYMGVAVADFNGDGILDIAGAGWGVNAALRVWLGTAGTGGWTALPPVAPGSYYSVSAADIDGDGRLDLAAAAYKAGVQLFAGDGRGGFAARARLEGRAGGDGAADSGPAAPPVFRPAEYSFWRALPVDVNGDGRLDIVAGSLDNQGVFCWVQEGASGWKAHSGAFPATGTYYGLAAADLDGDGRPEVCAANYGEGVKIWPGSPQKGQAVAFADPLGGASSSRAEVPGPRENAVFKTVNGVPEYKIGPGDTLEITLWEGTNAARQELLVRPDGRVSFGLVENLAVGGLTAGELDGLLTARLGQYFKRPQVDVVVKQHGSRSVRLMGAVARAGNSGTISGEHILRGRTTVLDVLTSWGGPTPDADLKSVRIRRKNGETVSLNLYRAIIQGDASQDLVLDDGDLIYLSTLSKEANRVYVFGEVNKPGAYTFSGSEMRLIDAISEAGGATLFALQGETKVVRGDITQPEVISSDLYRLIEKGDRSQNILLASGDLVYVPRSGIGDVKLFLERVRPMLELALWPARIMLDWKSAADLTGLR